MDIQMKEAGIRIRLESRLRDDFINACRSDDLTAAQVLRAFMRTYIEYKNAGRQPDLFYLKDIKEHVTEVEDQMHEMKNKFNGGV
jgi:hypothetical protein